MNQLNYIDNLGTFRINNLTQYNNLYFPIANEQGVMSSITPNLGGDSKISQNEFLLQPISIEDIHNSKSTRNFWININGKEVWSATGVSSIQKSLMYTNQEDEVSLEAGLMWHRIRRKNNEIGIQSTITSYVPCNGDKLELMKIDIENLGIDDMVIEAINAVPIYGRSADNIRDHRHVTSLLHRIETTEHGVFATPTLSFDERGHRKNKTIYGVLGRSEKEEGPVRFYPTIDDFIGGEGSLEHPRALYVNEESGHLSGYIIDGYEAFGGFSFPLHTLKAKESISYIIALSYGECKEDMVSVFEQYNTVKKWDASLHMTQQYWNSKNNVQLQTKDDNFNGWMKWVSFQPMLRRIYGCSFLPHHDYGKGGRGWRDLWQDCLALLLMNPTGVRELIVNNFKGVRIDGTNATIIGTKPGEFIADRNNIPRVWMDHGVWPLITLKLYVEHSNDLSILMEEVTYFKDRYSSRCEAIDEEWSLLQGNELLTLKNDVYQGTIFEHLLVQNLTSFYDVGEHNYIRIRGADWNDALDMAVKSGESVAFTSMYGDNLISLSNLLLRLNKDLNINQVAIASEILTLLQTEASSYDKVEDKKRILQEYHNKVLKHISGDKTIIDVEVLSGLLREKGLWILENIRNNQWINDSETSGWFNGYYDNNGCMLEGKHDLGVRLMLTSQVFAILSNAASDNQVRKMIQAVDAHLFDENIGGYRLNTDFKELKLDMGRMFGFAYGHKENGAVFSHMVVMYAYALYSRGYAKEGYKAIYNLYQHASDINTSKIYPGIPEYINQKGVGMYHYLTGSASWLLLAVLTRMFGVQMEYGDMKLEPKLLLEQFDENGMASIEFEHQNKKIRVEYYNKDGMEYGNYHIESISINEKTTIDNKSVIEHALMNQLEDERINLIQVYLEKKNS